MVPATRRTLLSLLIALFWMLAPHDARAQMETYRLDRPHTQVLFAVSHLGFSHSYGRFTDYSGQFTLNRGHLEGSSVEVNIRTDSVTMDDDEWTDAVKGDGYFDVAHYPVMSFKSTRVVRTGPGMADVFGNMTLLGVTRPAKFAVTLNKTGRHPFKEEYVAGLSGDGVINRSDFGMTGGLPLVGDEVKIHLEIEGNRIESPGQEFYNR
jgi:polyisoprenoid-binding protein YceI